jgi:hypothetical protein
MLGRAGTVIFVTVSAGGVKNMSVLSLNDAVEIEKTS